MDWFTAAGSIFQGMYDKSKQYQKEDFVLLLNEEITLLLGVKDLSLIHI